jgi:CRISPR-associated protein (TIGR03986 family)
MTADDKDHKTFPVRIGIDGKPYLPPTSIKGLLRSAYEAVTNSRLSVFESHDVRLAYRLPAKKGTSVIPARVEQRADGLYLSLLEAVNLPCYDNNGRISTRLKYPSSGKPPQHSEHVFVKVERSQNGIKKVAAIQPWKAEGPPSTDWHAGWVLITNANISKKKNERVFIEGRNHSAIKINKRISELWENLISNYQKEHEKELEKRKQDKILFDKYLGSDPGKTAWSRHIYDKEQLALKEGILCYAALEEGSDVNGEIDPRDVVALQPVTISRRLYDQKPVDLLPETLRPATDKNALSPADRVFGWVNQKGKGSYKGHLRIHSVECRSTHEQALSIFGNPGVPLAILGQPKPAQTRFYTAEDKQGAPIQSEKNKEYGYENKSRGLRGRKVYPHHRELPESYWQNPQEDLTGQETDGHYQVYRRPSGPDERDSQNRSITGWVNPGTSFQFEIDVNNLSTVELGALLWLLKLPEPYHHRLGGGKPLGFGSIRLDADVEAADIRTGQDWETFYRSLHSGDKPLFEHSACIAEYQTAVESAYKTSFDAVPFIAAFCRAAQGFEDGVPIHYPWNPETNGRPDPKGENFKWFTDNEQGDRWSLPSLTSGKALPLKPRTTEKSPQGSGPAPAALQRTESGVKPSSKPEKPKKPTRKP